MAGKLDGKVAIVTGSASGMGKAIAELYAQEGATVIVADLKQTAIDAVVDEINNAGGDASGFVADMSKENDIIDLVENVVEKYSHIDILVNNAGVMDNFVTVGNLDTDKWNKILAINLTGPTIASREVINVMLNQPDGGAIINVASVGGLFGARCGAAYIASKHGLIGITKNIAATYGRFKNIRANAIAPGGVKTNIGNTITEPDQLGLQAIGAAGESPMGDPADIAQVALLLGSDDAKFVNGTTITADGGWTAS